MYIISLNLTRLIYHIYHSLIYPWLTYGICAWGSSSLKRLKAIITQLKGRCTDYYPSAWICKMCTHTTRPTIYIQNIKFQYKPSSETLPWQLQQKHGHTKHTTLFDILCFQLKLCKNSMRIKVLRSGIHWLKYWKVAWVSVDSLLLLESTSSPYRN